MNLFRFNTRDPLSSFHWHIKCLQICGLWPPEDPKKKFFYEIYSWFLVVAFLYIFVLTQFIYLNNVKSIETFAEAFYFFLTESICILMHYCIKRNIEVVRKSLKMLESSRFLAIDKDEDKFLSWAMIRTIGFHRPSIGLCFICITVWSIFLLTPGSDMKSIVPAYFPFDFESGFGYFFVWIYQVFGTVFSALFYSTYDTLVTGIYFHLTAQVNRLGLHLAKIGYGVEETSFDLKRKNCKKNSETHKQQWIRYQIEECIKHHQEIMTLCEEFSTAVTSVIFIQMSLSAAVLCFTLFMIMNVAKGDIYASTNILPYFFTITNQVLQLTYSGNELLFASNKLAKEAYCSNFLEFSMENRKLLTVFMTRLNKEIRINTKAIFEIPLDLATFLGIMRASYSYFSVMKKVVSK